MPLLEVKNLSLDFVVGGRNLRALDGVSFTLEAGETLGLVGESGCGKSITGLSIARLVASPSVRYASGEILLEGRDVLRMSEAELRNIRGGLVGYVFQEPGVSLNPVVRIGTQVLESLKLHLPAKANRAEVVRLLKLVGVADPERCFRDYAFRLSGGMQQRVMLAMALAAEPQLLVADEPTTALDVTIQAQIMDLLREFKRRLRMAILLITHNLGIIGDIADRIAVMYGGRLVELAPGGELLRRPLHPYTRALMASVPRLNDEIGRLSGIPGTVPSLGNLPLGCHFAPRCPIARPQCSQTVPELVEAAPRHWVRCPYGMDHLPKTAK